MKKKKYPQVRLGDGVVSVHHQLLSHDRVGFLQFGGQEHAGRPQALKTIAVNTLHTQKSVQIVHSQWKHLLLHVLLGADL